jgi:hypothetical protein
MPAPARSPPPLLAVAGGPPGRRRYLHTIYTSGNYKQFQDMGRNEGTSDLHWVAREGKRN